jgi:hypothetical protein
MEPIHVVCALLDSITRVRCELKRNNNSEKRDDSFESSNAVNHQVNSWAISELRRYSRGCESCCTLRGRLEGFRDGAVRKRNCPC